MNYRVEKKGKIVIFHIFNRFDSISCYNIEENLTRIITKKGNKIIFSLKNVDHISSSGYRLLVSTLNDVKETEGQLIITDLPEQIKKVFHDIKLDQIFDIHETIDKALDVIKRAD